MCSFALWLDANSLENAGGRSDFFPALNVDAERVDFSGHHAQLDRLGSREIDRAQVVDGGKRVERRVQERTGLPIQDDSVVLVVELRGLVANLSAFHGVLLETQGAKRDGIDPGNQV